MERVLVNKIGQVQKRTLGGREYLVAPVTMIVPGVLNGSKGPVYYPPEEISKAVQAWNGVPIVLRHPMKNGQAVSARSPEVLDASGLGAIYNATLTDGQLTAEAWFDVANANRIDKRVVPLLEANQKIEVSTGLGIDLEEANAVHNGTVYSGIARGHKPDHLALLLDETGACSVDMGCGVNNEASLMQKLGEFIGLLSKPVINQETGMKKELVEFLTTNCDCWKGQTDTLNAMPEEQLKKLKAHVEKHSELVANAAKGETKTPPPVAEKVTLNTADILKDLAPEIRKLITNAVADVNERKPLVSRLLANVKAEERAAKEVVLNGKTLAELQEMASFLPVAREMFPATAGTQFLAGGPEVQNSAEDEADVLAMMPPVTNYGATKSA